MSFLPFLKSFAERLGILLQSVSETALLSMRAGSSVISRNFSRSVGRTCRLVFNSRTYLVLRPLSKSLRRVMSLICMRREEPLTVKERDAALAAASGKLRVPLFFIINAGIPLIFRTAGVFSPERLAIGAEMTA